jgi:glycerol-3-phosphate dehydrogenase
LNSQPVLILGAGINGASLARELALNDVSCWVVERGDIACGATSKSSRLIHGGLRYLEYGEFRLVREALVERDRLLRLAPQFVRPLTFAVPIRRRSGGWTAAIKRLVGMSATHRTPRGLWLTRTGLQIYDWFSRRSPLPSHSVSSRGPDVEPRVSETYRWVCRYADAQMQFPERYTLALLRDAQEISAKAGLDFRVLTHHQARRNGTTVQIFDRLREKDTTEPPEEVTAAIDRERTKPLPTSIEPPLIVNATGAWGDATLEQLGVPSRRLFGGTKGSHFLITAVALREAIGEQAVYAETSDGRFVFVLPFGKYVLIGTTDEPFPNDPHQAIATPAELDYLFEFVRSVFPSVELTAQDIVCHYSGVRPLPFAENLSPGAISRDHHVKLTEGDIPVLTLIGGKLTTSRQLGEQVADMVLETLGRTRAASTRDRIVPGGHAFLNDAAKLATRQTQLSHDLGCDPGTMECLESLCGNAFENALAGLSSFEREPIAGTLVPRGFARWVIRNEWVRSLADLVERRLMLVLTAQLSEETLSELAELMVVEQRLDARDVDREVDTCRRRLSDQYGYRW